MKISPVTRKSSKEQQHQAPLRFNAAILDVSIENVHVYLSNQAFDGAVCRKAEKLTSIHHLIPDSFWSIISNQSVYLKVSANPIEPQEMVTETDYSLDFAAEESISFPFDVITQPQVFTSLKVKPNEQLIGFHKDILREELIQLCTSLGWKTTPNFVRDLEIYIEQPQLEANTYKRYKKFVARFHHNEFNVDWLLSISYQTDVFTVPFALATVDDLRMNRQIIVNNTVWKRKSYQGDDEALENGEIVLHYDALSENMKRRKNPLDNHPMIFQEENRDVFNRLAKRLKETEACFSIEKPLEDEVSGYQTKFERFELSFQQGKSGYHPKKDLKQLGPVEKVTIPVRIIPIAPISAKREAEKLITHFLTENTLFNHIQNYFKSDVRIEKETIYYSDNLHPEREILKAVSGLDRRTNERHIALIVHPFQKHDEQEEHRLTYHRVKEALLNIGVVSQFIYKNHAYSSGLSFYNVNVASAMLAKAGFQPWRLKTPYTNSLVIGIGMFHSIRDQKKYSGVSVSLKGDGMIHHHEVFQDQEQDELMGMLHHSIRKALTGNPDTKSLIIHVLRQVSQKELRPLYAMLKSLKVKVPVYVVSINEGSNRQVFALNNRKAHGLLRSGTVIQQNQRQYLAFVNDYIQETDEPKRFLFPVVMQVTQLDFKEGNYASVDKEIANRLIEHAIQLARLNFQTVLTQPLPISVLAAKRIAEQMAYMESTVFPRLDRKQQWYW
ncbi:hypothetical protein EP331_11180 [bacterium]|nr:MAG: hypothetical protein EP331_11180 [bacterium]